MIERPSPLPLTRQCELLNLNRAALYYQPVEVRPEELKLMALIDRQYLRTPFYGSRRMAAWLQTQGYMVNRKRVQRLMRLMGLETIYQPPHTSRSATEHRRYPYLLRGLVIEHVNQVWAADITYIPMARGFLYLVAVMDWVSRYVLAWRLSNLARCELSYRGPGGSAKPGTARDLQHRSGQPVHRRRLHQRTVHA
jgi:putative transposase